MKIYLVGPPVQGGAAVAELAREIVQRRFGEPHLDVRVLDVAGPVTYKSAWIKHATGSSTRRPGTQVLEMWAVEARTPEAFERRKSFSVLVVEETVIGAFEPFVAVVLATGRVESEHVLQWRTSCPQWRRRDVWISQYQNIQQEQELRLTSSETLRNERWRGLWNLKALFPVPSPRRSQQDQYTDFVPVLRQVQLDSVLPKGLIKMLALSSPKPATFESLCQVLLDCEHGRVNIEDFPWIDATCALTEVRGPETLAQWKWASVIAHASSAVRQITRYHKDSPDSGLQARIVFGHHPSWFGVLGLQPGHGRSHAELLALAKTSGIDVRTISFGGTSITLVRGIQGRHLLSVRDDDAQDTEWPGTVQGRLILLEWTCVHRGVAYPEQRGVKVVSLHYVSKVDTSWSKAFFGSTLAVQHPTGAGLSVKAWMSPYIPHTHATYNRVCKSSEDHIFDISLQRLLCFADIRDALLPPAAFAVDAAPSDRASGRVYLALGGPGVGKTTEGAAPAVVRVAESGGFAILTSGLTHARNTHVHVLHTLMPRDLFERTVRVEGYKGVVGDPLVHSRTLPQLVRAELQPAIASWLSDVDSLKLTMLKVYVVQSLENLQNMSAEICKAIDKYGGFSSELADIHHRVAVKRCDIEDSIGPITNDIVARTRVVIGAMGAIAKPSHLRVLRRAVPDMMLSTLVLDEATRNYQFDLTNFLELLGPCIDARTRLAIAGDPTQLHCKLDLLPAVAKKSANWDAGASTMSWITRKIVDSSMSPEVLAGAVDFINRFRPSKRCRGPQAEAVTALALHCLPGSPQVWSRRVNGLPIWSPLLPRSARSPLDEYLDQQLPAVVSFELLRWTTSVSWAHEDVVVGQIGYSKYDLNVAFMAVVTALYLGGLEVHIKRTDHLQMFARSEGCSEETAAWQDEPCEVHVLCPYKAMVEMVKVALSFLKRVCSRDADGGSSVFDDVRVVASSVDAVQGDTKNIVVFAPPQEYEWGRFVTDPARALTMVSRPRRTLAVPRFSNAVSSAPNTGAVLHHSDNRTRLFADTMAALNVAATLHVDWARAKECMGLRLSSKEIWEEWITETYSYLKTSSETANARLEEVREVCEFDASGSPQIYSPVTLRACPLTFLRSIRMLLRVQGIQAVDMRDQFKELRVVAQNRKVVIAQTAKDSVWWGDFADWTIARLSEDRLWRYADGHLDHLLPVPVRTMDESHLYSFLVTGLGRPAWSEWAMARAEWLCVEVLRETLGLLRTSPSGATALELIKQECPAPITDVILAWTPHKIEVTEHDSTSRCGANDRADFMLLAVSTGDVPLRVLCSLYHTTNVPTEMVPDGETVSIPEGRLLARGNTATLSLIDRAVYNVAVRTNTRRHLSTEHLTHVTVRRLHCDEDVGRAESSDPLGSDVDFDGSDEDS